MEIEMTVKMATVDPASGMHMVVLRDDEGQHTLPIVIGPSEAAAITLQMEKVEMPRPLTHDLLKLLIEALGARVERIVVCDLRENTFFAEIHLKTAGGKVVVDARPSDAIALALRTESKIFVDEKVIRSTHSAEKSHSPIDIGLVQRYLENLPDDELGKYKM